MPTTARSLAFVAALLVGGAATALEITVPATARTDGLNLAAKAAKGAPICSDAVAMRVASCVKVCVRKVGNRCVAYETRCRGNAGVRG